MTGPIVLKLGGSVVTDKDRPETLDGPALDRAADAVSEAAGGAVDVGDRIVSGERNGGESDGTESERNEGLILVHGGGSFGHHHASERGVGTTDGTRNPDAVHAVHGAMKTLNRFVLGRLLDRGVPAVPVHPFSAASRDVEGELSLPTGQVETMLGEGFVPVVHGDVVAHAGEGVTIVSGDELVVHLARDLDAERIGLCSTVPGVLDEDDRVIDRIAVFEDVAAALGESESTDVTGGMAGKVETLLALDASASIFGLAELSAFLAGERPGTTVERE